MNKQLVIKKMKEERINVTELSENELEKETGNQFDKYTKLPIPIKAIQVNKPFAIDTLEGKKQRGKAGDYLLIGIEGERYPCDQKIFHKTYKKHVPKKEKK